MEERALGIVLPLLLADTDHSPSPLADIEQRALGSFSLSSLRTSSRGLSDRSPSLLLADTDRSPSPPCGHRAEGSRIVLPLSSLRTPIVLPLLLADIERRALGSFSLSSTSA